MPPTCDHNIDREEPGWWRSALTAAGLSLLFLAVYHSTNWITSQRADV